MVGKEKPVPSLKPPQEWRLQTDRERFQKAWLKEHWRAAREVKRLPQTSEVIRPERNKSREPEL